MEFLLRVFEEAAGKAAVIWRGREWSYRWLLDGMRECGGRFEAGNVRAGDAVALLADFSPNALTLLLACIARGTVVAPITPSAETKAEEFIDTAGCRHVVSVGDDDSVTIRRRETGADHEIYRELRRRAHPGLVLFSSGSTGESKAAVHDLDRLLAKFRTRRHDLRTLAFLRFDHIGGLDTLFYSLSNGSCLVAAEDRSPEAVCAAVERHQVQVLPVSPSFLNLLILSDAWRRHDLSSLVYVTYGAEVMPRSTLQRCSEIFPKATLLQKYGTTEVGTLRSKSRDRDSLWVKIGGEGYDTRVRDGKLEIKAESAMLGYLNAPSPFTEDGWFMTGDCVEVDGEWLRILGRDSDIVNVGGQKVYPAEVEAVIRDLDNVADVAVFGEPNPFLGQIVCAKVQLVAPEDPAALATRLRRHCAGRLQPYKVPVKVSVSETALHDQRSKTLRRRSALDAGGG